MGLGVFPMWGTFVYTNVLFILMWCLLKFMRFKGFGVYPVRAICVCK